MVSVQRITSFKERHYKQFYTHLSVIQFNFKISELHEKKNDLNEKKIKIRVSVLMNL